MIDFAKISVKAGNGGRGTGSFTHIKGKRRGKADGGDGGNGGNVFIEATLDLNTLEKYRYVKDYEAKNGQMGLSNRRNGANGEDLVLKVPVGTLVKAEGQSDFDLTSHGQRVLVARGGEGGRGNVHLKDEFGRRPLRGESGQAGETHRLTLELKLIADVGLIGLPNSGKSTLLAALTSAAPKIADYPFTTLEPNLGVMVTGSRKLVLADIPGLIEGASVGRGLGVLFLRHIERTKMLLHLIDISNANLDSIWKVYQTVRQELKAYSKDLAKKKEIIVLNKIDLVKESDLAKIKVFFAKKRKRTITISAKDKTGLELISQNL